MPPRRTLILAGVALAIGALLGAALVFPGGDLDLALRRALGGHATVVIRIVNLGTHDVDGDVSISKVGSDRLYQSEWRTTARGTTERTLEGRLMGEFLVTGVFTWSAQGQERRGDLIQRFDAGQCGSGQKIVVVFSVETTNGVSFPDGDDVRCE